jgi:hypothetical protein
MKKIYAQKLCYKKINLNKFYISLVLILKHAKEWLQARMVHFNKDDPP